MDNQNDIGHQIGAILNGIAALKDSGFISESNLIKANEIIGKFLDKASVCVDKLDLCSDEQVNNGGDNGGDNEWKPLAFVGFSVNLYSESTEGAQFKITVDDEEFLVNGSSAMSGIDMHVSMKQKLSNHPNFDLKDFYENGSPTNYGYVLQEKVSGSMFGKVVTMSASGEPVFDVPGTTSSFFWGNITINAVNTDQMMGKGQFIYSN